MGELDRPDGTESDAYGSQSVLAVLLGTGARTKLLAALLKEDYHDVNVSQLAELAGVHRTTVYDHLDDLEKLGVVRQTRSVGGSPMYQLDRDSPLAQDLKKLEGDLIDVIAETDDVDDLVDE